MILVTGATGFVGDKIMELCDDTVAAPSLLVREVIFPVDVRLTYN